jgi:MFS family permease
VTGLGLLATVLPELAPYVRHDLGGSDQNVGFVIGIFSWVVLAARFISGPLADRRERKVAFLIGLVSCAFAGGAYFLPLGIAGSTWDAFCKDSAKLGLTTLSGQVSPQSSAFTAGSSAIWAVAAGAAGRFSRVDN